MIMAEQWRATFEDTLNYQEEHRHKLDTFIKENRCLKEKERDGFFRLIGNAYLGEDKFKKFTHFLSSGKGVVSCDDFGLFVRSICYFDKNKIPLSFISKDSTTHEINISEVWKAIRYFSFSIYPAAQDKAISMSKERERKEMSKGASLDAV